MPEQHHILWPFGIRNPRLDRQPTRDKRHKADILWVDVVAQGRGIRWPKPPSCTRWECSGWADHFPEPGKALHTLAMDEQTAATQD